MMIGSVRLKYINQAVNRINPLVNFSQRNPAIQVRKKGYIFRYKEIEIEIYIYIHTCICVVIMILR